MRTWCSTARHSFATDTLDKTGNIVLVGKMLGHRSVTTMQRYLHTELKDIADPVNERNTTNQDAVLRHSSASVQWETQLSCGFSWLPPRDSNPDMLIQSHNF